jgi:hypothetical protein
MTNTTVLIADAQARTLQTISTTNHVPAIPRIGERVVIGMIARWVTDVIYTYGVDSTAVVIITSAFSPSEKR